MDNATQWAFDFFEREAKDYAAIEWSSQATAYRALLKGADDPPFIKAVRHIHDALARKEQRERFFLCLADVVAEWNPGRIDTMRAARDRLDQLNNEIADRARELAQLMETRSRIVNKDGVGADPGVGLWELLDEWADGYPAHGRIEGGDVHRYSQWLRPEIESLQRRFDGKYWPSMLDLLYALHSACSREDNPHTRSPINVTEGAIDGRENSLRTFVRCLITRIKNDTEDSCTNGPALGDFGMFPADFSLGATDMAAVLTVALERYADPVSADNLRKMPEYVAWAKKRKITDQVSRGFSAK